MLLNNVTLPLVNAIIFLKLYWSENEVGTIHMQPTELVLRTHLVSRDLTSSVKDGGLTAEP